MLCQKIFIVFLLFSLFFPIFAQEENKPIDQEEKKEEATMPQEKKENEAVFELKAIGKGLINLDSPNKAQAKLMAERAAKVDAMRNLLVKIQNIVTGEENQDRVSGFLSGHTFQNMQISEDGTFVTIEVVLPLEALLKNYYQSVLFLEQEQEKAKELEEKTQKQQENIEKLKSDWETYKKEQEKILQEKQEKIESLEKSLESEKKNRQDRAKEESFQENALLIQKQKQEIALLVEQKEKEIQENFIKNKKIEELENAFQALQTRYQEQQKALLAFEENKKNFTEYTKKQELLEKELQESLARKKLLEKKIEELSLLLEKENNLSDLRKLQQEQSELQENFKKLIEILGHIHYENKELSEKYQEAMKNLIEKEGELIRVKENLEIYKIRLQNLQRNLEEAKQKYNLLSQGYQNLLSQNKIAIENISKTEALEQTIQKIYANQQIFLNKFEAIEGYLQTLDEFLKEE